MYKSSVSLHERNLNYLNLSHKRPWDFFMDMAKAKRIRNYTLLKGIVESDGIIRMRGNRTTFPLSFPVKMGDGNITGDRCITVEHSNHVRE